MLKIEKKTAKDTLNNANYFIDIKSMNKNLSEPLKVIIDKYNNNETDDLIPYISFFNNKYSLHIQYKNEEEPEKTIDIEIKIAKELYYSLLNNDFTIGFDLFFIKLNKDFTKQRFGLILIKE